MLSVEEIAGKFGFIAESPDMKEILKNLRQIAPSDITVLITGESGVGKELIAKAIHGLSHRSTKQMVSVNCGAIPEGIIESELFGHEKGAFTSATDTRKGYFELADGGTIFLDEIGELPLQTQVKFLRVLENGEFMRVGSSSPRRSDVRVIAATNKDIEREVKNGQFRVDLYYRLRSVNIRIPPLRDRMADIIPLVERFTEEVLRENNMASGGFSPEALEELTGYDWPGNIRELRNVVDSLIVLQSGREIQTEDVRQYLTALNTYRSLGTHDGNNDSTNPFLPVRLNKTSEQAERELIYRALLEMKRDIVEIKDLLINRSTHSENVPLLPEFRGDESKDTVPKRIETLPTIEEMEKSLIIEALKRTGGRRRDAAKALNISERTLYRKIKEYDL